MLDTSTFIGVGQASRVVNVTVLLARYSFAMPSVKPQEGTIYVS